MNRRHPLWVSGEWHTTSHHRQQVMRHHAHGIRDFEYVPWTGFDCGGMYVTACKLVQPSRAKRASSGTHAKVFFHWRML